MTQASGTYRGQVAQVAHQVAQENKTRNSSNIKDLVLLLLLCVPLVPLSEGGSPVCGHLCALARVAHRRLSPVRKWHKWHTLWLSH